MAMPAPGQVANVAATAGFDSANVTWSAPSTGGAPTQLHRDPVHRLHRPDAHHCQRHAPRDQRDDLQPRPGHGVHLHRAGGQPGGQRPRVGRVELRDADGPAAPAAPTNVSANPASGQAQVSWTAPNSNGSAITGYTITPFIGSTAQTPVQVLSGTATSATVTGLKVGTSYTFTVTATNNIGTGPASTPSSAVTPADTILDFSTPQTVDSGDTTSVELGVKWTADSSGTVTGHPLLQGLGQRRDPRREPVDLHRHPAGVSHVHQRNILRLAVRDVLHPGGRHGGHHLRRGLPRAARPLLVQRVQVQSSVDNAAAARACRTRQAPTASTRTPASARSPPTATTPATTGST